MSPARRTALCAVAAAGLLLAVAPGPAAALRVLRAAGTQTDPSAPLVAAVAVLAWSLTLWLLVLIGLTVAGRLPGLLGGACRGLSRRIAPAAVRRAVEVALGLCLATGVAGAGPAAASAGLSGLDPAGTSAPPADRSLDWPTAPAAPLSAASPVTAAADPAAVDPAATAASRDAVVVRPGDTLWGLAERSLRDAGDHEPTVAEVAQTWPSWWSANRDAVGDDPDLLRPGTALTPPPTSGTSPSDTSPSDTSPSDTSTAPTDATTSSTDGGSGADGAGPASS